MQQLEHCIIKTEDSKIDLTAIAHKLFSMHISNNEWVYDNQLYEGPYNHKTEYNTREEIIIYLKNKKESYETYSEFLSLIELDVIRIGSVFKNRAALSALDQQFISIISIEIADKINDHYFSLSNHEEELQAYLGLLNLNNPTISRALIERFHKYEPWYKSEAGCRIFINFLEQNARYDIKQDLEYGSIFKDTKFKIFQNILALNEGIQGSSLKEFQETFKKKPENYWFTMLTLFSNNKKELFTRWYYIKNQVEHKDGTVGAILDESLTQPVENRQSYIHNRMREEIAKQQAGHLGKGVILEIISEFAIITDKAYKTAEISPEHYSNDDHSQLISDELKDLATPLLWLMNQTSIEELREIKLNYQNNAKLQQKVKWIEDIIDFTLLEFKGTAEQYEHYKTLFNEHVFPKSNWDRYIEDKIAAAAKHTYSAQGEIKQDQSQGQEKPKLFNNLTSGISGLFKSTTTNQSPNISSHKLQPQDLLSKKVNTENTAYTQNSNTKKSNISDIVSSAIGNIFNKKAQNNPTYDTKTSNIRFNNTPQSQSQSSSESLDTNKCKIAGSVIGGIGGFTIAKLKHESFTALASPYLYSSLLGKKIFIISVTISMTIIGICISALLSPASGKEGISSHN